MAALPGAPASCWQWPPGWQGSRERQHLAGSGRQDGGGPGSVSILLAVAAKMAAVPGERQHLAGNGRQDGSGPGGYLSSRFF